MNYISTRGQASALPFKAALLAGLARDGGLYMPATWPRLEAETMRAFRGQPFAEVAEQVIAPFAPDIPPVALRAMLTTAWAGFRHPAVAPLVQLDANLFVLELFHGPTLAFKDVAMQLLGLLMDQALRETARRATIVGATSGDTGAAAIEAFAGVDNVDVFILYPHGRVSDVQRRQMTGVAAANVHTLAIDGTFDDCQALVKAMFAHAAFRDDLALSGVNSINWARIVAQTVYYFTGAIALGAPDRKVSFCVPTGNFGDVLAGHIAGLMGLPIERLVVAANENDILARALHTGVYEVRGVVPTQSPSMDIQVSSNFERLLFEAGGGDAAATRGLMDRLAQSGRFEIPAPVLDAIRARFDAASVDRAATDAEMARTFAATGYTLDPHTAVAVCAARAALQRDPATPMIALATAHPAKFPDAVEKATGARPALPAHLADLLQRPERIARVANDLGAVEKFIRARSRIAGAA